MLWEINGSLILTGLAIKLVKIVFLHLPILSESYYILHSHCHKFYIHIFPEYEP